MYLATETLAGVSVAFLFFHDSDRRVGQKAVFRIPRPTAVGREVTFSPV